VAAEPVPEAVREATGELPRFRGARIESFAERLVDEWHGDLLFERFLHGPRARGAAFDAVRDRSEVAALLAERFLAELQKPRPDDGAVVPRARHGFQVEVVPAVRE
jgi:hypothetical protein